MPFVALEGSSKMQVLRVKAARAVRAFAEAIPDIDEVTSTLLQRSCNLLAEASPDIDEVDTRHHAEAYGIWREIRQMTSRLGAAEDNTNYSDAMR